MRPALAHAAGGGGAAALWVAALGVGYLLLAQRCGRDGRRSWGTWRSVAFIGGTLLLGLGLTPHVLPFPDGDLRQHMLQHLLIGMVAPLGLVLGAPVTLILRSVPTRHGRLIVRALRSRPVHLVANPVVALVLNVGGMAVLYATPLYVVTTRDATIHHLVNLHVLAAGCLFTWVIAGPDPAPRRPSVPARLVVLGVAIALHSSIAQLLHAGVLLDAGVPPAQLRGGATLMYYGGDIAEIMLAFALVTTWRPVAGRRRRGRVDHGAARQRRGGLRAGTGS